jgi:cyclophilin family peptidyl-prolyl cis-trans isomerase
MVLDKLSTRLARQVDFTFTLLERVEHGFVVREGDPDPQPGKKGEKLLGVRFTLQG